MIYFGSISNFVWDTYQLANKYDIGLRGNFSVDITLNMPAITTEVPVEMELKTQVSKGCLKYEKIVETVQCITYNIASCQREFYQSPYNI